MLLKKPLPSAMHIVRMMNEAATHSFILAVLFCEMWRKAKSADDTKKDRKMVSGYMMSSSEQRFSWIM